MAVKQVKRGGKTRLVIDILYRNLDGSRMRFRRDAEVQTKVAAQAEERRRVTLITTTGSPWGTADGAPPRPSSPVAPKNPKAVDTPSVLSAPSAPSFKDVAADYLKVFAPSHLKASTIHGYSTLLHTLLVPRFGDLPIDKVSASHMRELDADLVERKARPSTRRQALSVVRSVLCRYAVEADLLPAPGPRFPPLPRVGNTIKEVLTPEQVQSILAASPPPQRRAFMLAAYAGLRAGEVRGLRWCDVDLNRHQLVVRVSICRGVEGTPKSGHERIVPLVKALLDEFDSTKVRPRDAPVAPDGSGKVWAEFALTKAFKRACTKAKLDKGWRLHDLRHAFVTMLFRAGAAAPVVRALAGHANLATTQRYAHVVALDLTRAIDQLGKIAV